MDRKSFIKRAVGLGVALYALDGDAVEKAFTDYEATWGEFVDTIPESTSMSTVDAILKNYYLPVVQEQLNQPSILLREAE